MAHTLESRKALLSRVRRIQGQLVGLEKALDDSADCGDLLQQIAAVRGAVDGLMNEVLESHMRQHLVPAEQAPPDELEGILRVIRAYMR